MAKSAPKKDKLLDALEDAMLNDLKAINATALIPDKKGEGVQQGPLWAPKDRVSLYEVVIKHQASKQSVDGKKWGESL